MSIRLKKYNFHKSDHSTEMDQLKAHWLKSLVAPQDDMWESFMNYAQHWNIKDEGQQIGYACINDENCLLQFFILPYWLQEGVSIFQQFIDEQDITKGIIGTNNPIYCSLAMQFQKSVKVDTYLFGDFIKIEPIDRVEKPRLAQNKDLDLVVEFCHLSMGAPKEWLTGYVSNLIEKSEFFILDNNQQIIGTFEVRKSESNFKVANIGMVVSPEHRRKGIGTYLLGAAKTKAIEWNRDPVCSCEKDNIGSLKAIQKNGFRSIHQMLSIEF